MKPLERSEKEKEHIEKTSNPDSSVCSESLPFAGHVPDEILARIFGYVEKLSQLRLRRVCQQWNCVLRMPCILRHVKLDMLITRFMPWPRDNLDNTVNEDPRCRHTRNLSRFASPCTENLILFCEKNEKSFALAHRLWYMCECSWPFLGCRYCKEESGLNCSFRVFPNLKTLVFHNTTLHFSHFACMFQSLPRSGARLIMKDVDVLGVSRFNYFVFDEQAYLHESVQKALPVMSEFHVKIGSISRKVPGDKRENEVAFWDVVQTCCPAILERL